MRAAWSDDHNGVVRKINATLQGPVIDVLAELVPEVRQLPRRHALDAVLDDIDLLNRCFLAFRANPDRFRHLLVNKHHVSVEHAEALLECGRSLDQVVAMVVRTAAKRHFRRRLDGAGSKTLRSKPPRHQPRQTLVARILALLSSHAPAPARQPTTRGELLYEAFQEYLLHDWQVPMIPEYCLLTPGTVRRLGSRLLDYRIAEDIRRLRVDPDNPPPPTPLVSEDESTVTSYMLPPIVEAAKEGQPAAVTAAEKRVSDGMAVFDYGTAERTARDERARLDDILTPDGRRLRPDAFTIVLLDPQVRAALPHSEQTVRITGILGSVNGLTGKMLVGELALRVDQLAVFLMTAHSLLGAERFRAVFGLPGRPEAVMRIVERAKAAKIGQDTTLPVIAAFVTRTLGAAAKP